MLNKNVEQDLNFCGIVGCSERMMNIFENVRQISETDANVLIVGESGTGKELLAKAIHSKSNRKNTPFIPVACASLPDALLESELFGYEKGAFTGAQSTKMGLMELASRGTLFLDEISEIPLLMQPKLLRCLQDRKIRRVGGLKEIDLDIRLISASNVDPSTIIGDGKFREDLYYRLNVIKFELPPLRMRKDDIPILTGHFIRKFSKYTKNEIIGIEDEALDGLMKYDWPGNIRQLENVIERAVIFCKESKIKLADLPLELTDKKEITQKTFYDCEEDFKEMKRRYIEEFEKKYINELLNKYSWNISQAAKRAHLNRRTIYRMIDYYQLKSKV